MSMKRDGNGHQLEVLSGKWDAQTAELQGSAELHRAAALHGAAALHRAVLASAQLTDARGTWIRLTHVRGFVNVWLYHLFLIHIFVCSSSSHASPIVIVSLRRGRAAFGRSACCQPCGTLRCPPGSGCFAFGSPAGRARDCAVRACGICSVACRNSYVVVPRRAARYYDETLRQTHAACDDVK